MNAETTCPRCNGANSGWPVPRSIDTAPKDGTHILTFSHADGYWIENWWKQRSRFQEWARHSSKNKPELWLPMPPPAKQSVISGAGSRNLEEGMTIKGDGASELGKLMRQQYQGRKTPIGHA